MLVLSRKKEEAIILTWKDQEVTIVVSDIRGDRVRIGIQAPLDIHIRRSEIPPHEPPQLTIVK